MTAHLDESGYPTPACKVLILGMILQRAALYAEPVDAVVPFREILAELGVDAPEMRSAIHMGVSVLLNAGLLKSPMLDPVSKAVSRDAPRTLAPSDDLSRYIRKGDVMAELEADDA